MKVCLFIFFLLMFPVLQDCTRPGTQGKVRSQVDTIGFAQYSWQMDSIFARIAPEDKMESGEEYKMVICPHDDYAYAGGLYSLALSGVKAPVVILLGVAHKARQFGLENELVFGTYTEWKAPPGNVRVSKLRDSLLARLSPETFIVHDSMMMIEHSLEAIVPFLQRNNKCVEIVPVLVPYMDFSTMQKISAELAMALSKLMKDEGMVFGKDLAVVISNDALHYGDQDWGGADMAPYGCDSVGNAKANAKDKQIIEEALTGPLSSFKARAFYDFTVSNEDYKAYAWTWCGRYSVPFGMLLSAKLQEMSGEPFLEGSLLDYRSSLLNPHLKVDDLGMGVTAPANDHHWVSYVGMVYR